MGFYKVRIEFPNGTVQVRNISTISLHENTISSWSSGGYAIPNYSLTWAEYIGNIRSSMVSAFGVNLLDSFSSSTLFFALDGYENYSAPYSVMSGAGYTNGFKLSASAIGTKIRFNNNNYVEIYQFSNNRATLRYCLDNGTVCAIASNLPVSNGSTVVSTFVLPWFNGNTTRPGFIDMRPSCWNTGLSGGYWIRNEWNVSNALVLAFFDGMKELDPLDPYIDIDDSVPSGTPSGGGIPSGNAVSIPSLPTVSVADTGFVTLFNPTLGQVKNLASYMWGSLFDISTFKKIFADPMDCILGFNLLPVAIPNGGSEDVIVGNISTGVSMTKAGSQWVEVDCGTVNIGTPYDNYLDYSPYTKYSIYLPYIGTVDLSADDCVGKNIHLVYHVDVLSCSCVAYLKCGDSVLYQFTGSCGYSIPLTSENFRSMISSIVSIAGSIAGVVASGGASAPLTIGAVANTANNVMGLKPDIHRSGAIGSSAGLMGIQTPYLILQFPNPCKPSQQYKYTGYPSFVTVTVGDLSGYAEFESIILDEVTCDEDEKQLIEDILKGGVFL